MTRHRARLLRLMPTFQEPLQKGQSSACPPSERHSYFARSTFRNTVDELTRLGTIRINLLSSTLIKWKLSTFVDALRSIPERPLPQSESMPFAGRTLRLSLPVLWFISSVREAHCFESRLPTTFRRVWSVKRRHESRRTRERRSTLTARKR